MKQVLLDLSTGKVSVEEVPIPTFKGEGVIIENKYSLISAGTESYLINLAKKSLIGKAKERPDLAKKVINKAKKEGPLAAYQQAMSRLSKPEPLGYSCAGIVRESNTSEFEVGDKVACGGAGYAVHAEYVYVPKNLCVKVPDNVSLREAAFTTIGAIAVHGVRNAKVSFGDRVVVIGLGLIGVLTVQILKAAGCKVFGIDVDPAKIRLALELGADFASNYDNITGKIKKFSEFGADAVIITASTKSSQPIEVAGELVREKGRVVVVGNVDMNVPRDIYYKKEAEVVVSKSYGPGRYDPIYEEKGIDYPVAYVRWTERRNMEAFLELVSEKKINLEKLITHEFPVEDAAKAYNLIMSKKKPYIGILLKYNAKPIEEEKASVIIVKKNATKKGDNDIEDIGIGFIGAGIHATSALLPNLKKLNANLVGIATATGISAKSAAKKYGFKYATTNYKRLLEDPEIDAIFIATRNDLHAKLTIEALKASKDVFVEKPLAVNIEQLKEVVRVWQEQQGTVMVGFNRRYSSLTRKLKETFSSRGLPMMLNYRVNTGNIPKEHWAHEKEQGGGMIVTEGCHFIDFANYMTGSVPVEVYARTIGTKDNILRNDNIQMIISYEDGSLATVTYTTLGSDAYSKEMVEVFADGMVGMIKDFRELVISKKDKTIKEKKWLGQDKGFLEEIKAFLTKKDNEDFMSYVYTTLVSFKAIESIISGKPEKINLKEIIKR